MKKDIKELIAEMTLEEKASLCSGLNFWNTKGIERLGIPAIMMTDGPHGLRKQTASGDHVGLGSSVPATCFPSAAATACSWDRELLRDIGRALGEECLNQSVSVLLGPGANIKRSPLCGRNFEYFSEDPYLAGEMSAAWIEGIQEKGVGASLKHFAVNNQENRRMTIDAEVDERALNEIYLAGFETAVKKAQPWTVMCAYNHLNGTYCSENEELLTKVLRDDWGFQGVVVTDWGACNDRVAGLAAGQELEMPSSGGLNDKLIVKAVKAGKLDVAVLDQAVERLLRLISASVENSRPDTRSDMDAHHALARSAAAQSAVLLKNEGGILPLKKDERIAVIGAFAKTPRYQGSGSSLINPARMECAWEEMLKYAPECTYSAGYRLDTEEVDEQMIAEACTAAKAADAAVIFAGLTPEFESEGFDREHMRMPENHNELIRHVAQANPNTVVVLSKGAPVEMPWVDDVKAVLDGYLGGQAGGGGIADILFGKVNPSGKLAETQPLKLEDALSSRYFPMGPNTVQYRESLYVGYRWFDAAKVPVQFPFGHGLSYTSFEYSYLTVDRKKLNCGDGITVSLTVKNSGDVAGAEVVELYVHDVKATAFRPEKELNGFAKVFLKPGEQTCVSFRLDKRSFAYYNTAIQDWHVESGDFELLVGASSADIRLKETVWVQSDAPDAPIPDLRDSAPSYYEPARAADGIADGEFAAVYGRAPSTGRDANARYTLLSTLGDVRHTLAGKFLYNMMAFGMKKIMGPGESKLEIKMMEKMMDDMPLRNLVTMSGGKFTPGLMRFFLRMMNVGRK